MLITHNKKNIYIHIYNNKNKNNIKNNIYIYMYEREDGWDYKM